MSLKILNANDFFIQAKSRIVLAILNQVLPKVLSDPSAMIAAFINALQRTLFFQALAGQGVGDGHRDFNAVMGINDNRNAFIQAAIIQIVSESIQFSSGGATADSVRFNIRFSSLPAALASAGFAYESKGGPVPWMEWLLTGGSTPGYDIQFTDSSKSRSGRALMIPSTFTWSIDGPSERFAEGENFVVDTLSDPTLPLELEKALEISILEVIKSNRIVVT